MADHSVLLSFSALNVQVLSPDAPEYIPILHNHRHHHLSTTTTSTTNTTTTTTTSDIFYFQRLYHHQQSYIPPPPPQPPAYTLVPASFYFQPFFHLTPQPNFTHFVPHPPVQHQLTWSQPCAEQVQGSDDTDRGGRVSAEHGSGNGSRRCSGGRWRTASGARVWRVKSGRRSSTLDPLNRRIESGSNENREGIVTLTSSSFNEDQREDSGEWRTVKYKACKKHGKKFEIQPVEKSVKKTTVMIRNIPSRYTREMMLTFLDRHCIEANQQLNVSHSATDDRCCFSAYDFFYMPIDFKTGLNKSYAFVNFTTPEAVWRFHAKCDTKKWELFESNKIRQIALAKLQGTGELVEHFGRTAFACDRDEFLPVYFQPPRDGCADVDRVTSIIGKRVS